MCCNPLYFHHVVVVVVEEVTPDPIGMGLQLIGIHDDLDEVHVPWFINDCVGPHVHEDPFRGVRVEPCVGDDIFCGAHVEQVHGQVNFFFGLVGRDQPPKSGEHEVTGC